MKVSFPVDKTKRKQMIYFFIILTAYNTGKEGEKVFSGFFLLFFYFVFVFVF